MRHATPLQTPAIPLGRALATLGTAPTKNAIANRQLVEMRLSDLRPLQKSHERRNTPRRYRLREMEVID